MQRKPRAGNCHIPFGDDGYRPHVQIYFQYRFLTYLDYQHFLQAVRYSIRLAVY